MCKVIVEMQLMSGTVCQNECHTCAYVFAEGYHVLQRGKWRVSGVHTHSGSGKKYSGTERTVCIFSLAFFGCVCMCV